MIKRLICRLRGHVPPFFNVTASIPGVTLMSECPRCHRLTEYTATIKTGTASHLTLVKPKDAA